jgi:hypothetical protein
LRGWEAREGRNYKPTRDDPYMTQTRPPEHLETLRQAMDSSTPNSPKRNVIRRIAPQAEMPNEIMTGAVCPECLKINAPGEAYCYSCGSLLAKPGGTQRIGDTQPVNTPEQTASYFGDHMVAYLQLRGIKEMIRLQPRSDEMVIGRQSPENVMLPDIDLAPFHAATMGVSRMHAGLRRQGDTLVLCDLGSTNHTYINGQRLFPHEVRVLHDGDELRFGQMQMRVHFRKA